MKKQSISYLMLHQRTNNDERKIYLKKKKDSTREIMETLKVSINTVESRLFPTPPVNEIWFDNSGSSRNQGRNHCVTVSELS